MKCEQIKEMIGPYLYGDLSPDEMKEVRRHTDECLSCKEDLESQGQVLSHIKNDVPPLSNEDRQRISWAVRGAVRQNIGHRPWRIRFVPAFAAALLIFAVVVAGSLILANNRSRNISQQPTATVKPKQSNAIVSIKETNSTTKSSIAVNQEQKSRKLRRSRFCDFTQRINRNAVRFTNNMATSRHGVNRNDHTDVIPPDKPAEEVTSNKDNSLKDSGTNNDGMKLPKPSDKNDATTLPKQQEQTNDKN